MEKLLTLFPELQLMPERRRVRCLLSGHEMPCDVGVVKQYLEGKQFKKLKEVKAFDYKKYEPLIVPSVKRRNTLYCQLTGRYINMVPSHVEKHTIGKKFIRAKKNYKEGLKELKYETKVKKNQEKIGKEEEESNGDTEERNDSISDKEIEEKDNEQQSEEMEEEDHDELRNDCVSEKPEEKLVRKRKSNALTTATSSKRRKLLKLARLRLSRVTN